MACVEKVKMVESCFMTPREEKMACVEKVKVVESCIVKPSEETPRHGLWLSPVDLMMVNRGHTPAVYFYHRSASGFGVANDFFDVARMKAAMAKSLVNFYPLAGRLGVDGDGRAEIDCAGQGAHFVVARSDLTVDDFSSCQPSPELRRLFVPGVVDDSPHVMLAVQLTFFKCGGVALGTALHHVVIDAVSAFHFFETWSAFSRAGGRDNGVAEALELPCHDRSLLRARSPPRVVHPDALAVFCPLQNDPNVSAPGAPPGPVVNEIFVLSKDQIAALKHACGGASTFCAVSAHVWRCMCVARRLAPDATTRLTFPANFRRILRPPLPARYFGNGIIVVGAAGKVRDIASEDQLTLASVAERVKDAIRGLDDELVRSTIDYLEMNEAPPANSMPETEVRVVSWLGMPVYDADFGWGKPLTMMRAVQQRAGLIYLVDDDGQGDGGVRVLVSIEAAVLNDFQRVLSTSF